MAGRRAATTSSTSRRRTTAAARGQEERCRIEEGKDRRNQRVSASERPGAGKEYGDPGGGRARSKVVKTKEFRGRLCRSKTLVYLQTLLLDGDVIEPLLFGEEL